jgi:hypothetical protein
MLLFITDINPQTLLALLVAVAGLTFWYKKMQADEANQEADVFYKNAREPFVIFARTLEENGELLDLAKHIQDRLAECGNQWHPPVVVIPFQGLYQGKSLRQMDWETYQRFCRNEFIRVESAWQEKIAALNPKLAMEKMSGQKGSFSTNYDWDAATNQLSRKAAAAA